MSLWRQLKKEIERFKLASEDFGSNCIYKNLINDVLGWEEKNGNYNRKGDETG